jgi:Flp pilus assembly protein TadD
MEHNRKTTLRQKLILTGLGFLLTLIVLEVGLRLGGFIISSLQERRNKISLQQKGVFRILCLGESTTARQYPPFLEEELNSHNKGIKFSVIDKGADAITTLFILARLESYLDTYNPDMVITMMGVNDFGSHMPVNLRNPVATTFWQSLRIYKLARLLWLHLVTRLQELGLSKRNSQPKLPSQQDGSQKTEAALKQVVALNPKEPRVYAELARFYQDQGEPSEAEAVLKQAIALNPKAHKTYAELAWFYWRHGRRSETEAVLKQAIALNPKVPETYAELAWLYWKQGEPSEEEAVLKQGIALNPKVPEAYAELVWSYWRHGRFSEAEAVFKQAIALNPKAPETYAELAWRYWKDGKSSEAEALLKQAIALNPKEGILYRALKLVYAEMGNTMLAREYDKKLQELKLANYHQMTVDNYRKLKAILDKRGIAYVCVQYPMRSLGPLKKIFQDSAESIVFVDNEEIFMNAVTQAGYEDYFRDMFGGDFGHCTDKGNRLLAENIANVILKEVFGK